MALRLRLLSSCKRALRSFIRVVSWLPVVFVTALMVWGYFVYVWVMNLSGKATINRCLCYKLQLETRFRYEFVFSLVITPGKFPKGPPHVSAFVSGKYTCSHVHRRVTKDIYVFLCALVC